MVVPFTALYLLNGVGLLCATVSLIAESLRGAPISIYSVRYKVRRAVLIFMLGLVGVVYTVLTFGTAVPGVGYRMW